LFDLEGWRAAFTRALASGAGRSWLQYGLTEGNLQLRELLAERMTGRGLITEADDLVVTTGSQRGQLCHVGLVVHGRPSMLPAGHVRVEDTLYVRGPVGSSLLDLPDGRRGSADQISSHCRRQWSLTPSRR
jgi:hypothetical protein